MFAARLLLGEFVTGYEVSGWYGVGAPKGTPVEVIDELNKEIQGIIDRNCAWHFVTSPRRCAEYLDWRHPPRIGAAPRNARDTASRAAAPTGKVHGVPGGRAEAE